MVGPLLAPHDEFVLIDRMSRKIWGGGAIERRLGAGTMRVVGAQTEIELSVGN